ncbi:MAG: tRNA (N6-isopentenyl adenosine(37)-C2)-methylthiotransferase MiaB [Deltaproteobacteria bacterium]|nr:tRNA (N6-isopentenyl adenosine(37)-C2)-methylthiotransferase MiaB [Deltaproteobacteria bacterium]
MKIYTKTYGCQMNEHDSARILQVMKQQGYTPTERAEEADLIILNTCSVRDKAQQKVYSALGRWRKLKEQREGLIIGVAGCVAQQEGEELLRRVPYLDLVFGTHNIHKLGQMVREVQNLASRPVEVAFYRSLTYLENLHGRPEVHGPKAYVTIMQGCNKVCSFCIVPHVRGREISRPSDNIINEVRELTGQGVREVMLLGQNVNSYGKTGQRELTFAELLHKINEIDGLDRIRFTTSHPQDLSPQLIDAYAVLGKLCEHLHLPVQSGSDTVLQRMRRGYSRKEYMDRIHRLRDRCPEVALSTDIIVGFPGETEDEFETTLEILEKMEYDEIFAFKYSPRPQTVAAKIHSDDVPEETKKSRLKTVQALQKEISLRKNRQLIGRVEEILLEGESKLSRDQMMGRTRTNKVVNVEAPRDLVGKTLEVRITGASANSLIGELH